MIAAALSTLILWFTFDFIPLFELSLFLPFYSLCSFANLTGWQHCSAIKQCFKWNHHATQALFFFPSQFLFYSFIRYSLKLRWRNLCSTVNVNFLCIVFCHQYHLRMDKINIKNTHALGQCTSTIVHGNTPAKFSED